MDTPKFALTGSAQRRTNVACRRCHSKKIKCDGEDGAACTGCISTKTECIRIQSQRGRYIRKRSQAQKNRKSQLSHGCEGILRSTEASSTSEGPDNGPQLTIPPNPGDALSPLQTIDGATNREIHHDRDKDSDHRVYLNIADQGVSSTPQLISRERKTLFLGESFSLTYVVHDVLAPFLSAEHAPHYRKRLHFPVEEGIVPSLSDYLNLVNYQKKLLKEREIFFQPGQMVTERLLVEYFKWFHPAFPVLDRSSFIHQLNGSQVSLLVLNSVFLIAVSVCDEENQALLGVQNRHQGRELFYQQARTLYEADADPDKLSNVVSTFLISFWWGGPNDQKDSWHWLGIATSLAQNLGMHRSTAESHMSSYRAKMWRRIWWCIRLSIMSFRMSILILTQHLMDQIRDTLVSSSIGRPQHFSIYDCDVEMLTPQDLESEFQCGSEVMYSCQMARLCSIFSSIISSRYAAVKPDDPSRKKVQLENELEEFRLEIPGCLVYNGVQGSNEINLWAVMLLMAYNFGAILLSRPPRASGSDTSQPWGNYSKALAAANETTRLMEDILSLSMGRMCQIQTIPALFNSLAIHVFTICTSQAIEKQLAESRARICMLGLMSLQDSWLVSGWILQLFIYIMERLKARPRQLAPETWPSKICNNDSSSITTIDELAPLQSDSQFLENRSQIPDRGNISYQQMAMESPVAASLFEDFEISPDLFLTDQYGDGQEIDNENFFDLLQFPMVNRWPSRSF